MHNLLNKVNKKHFPNYYYTIVKESLTKYDIKNK